MPSAELTAARASITSALALGVAEIPLRRQVLEDADAADRSDARVDLGLAESALAAAQRAQAKLARVT